MRPAAWSALGVEPVGDLLALHATAAVELRVVPSLRPMVDQAQSGEWDFSNVRVAATRLSATLGYDAVISRRKASALARRRVRFIGGSALTMSHR